jgi:hypothetical protein
VALVERLMGLNSNGTEPAGPPDQPKIPVHDFFAAGQELVMGRLTVAQIKTALEMDAAAQSEFDAMVALAPTGTSTMALVLKAQYVDSLHSIFILAEGRYQGYHTAAAVRTKLGLT